MRTLLSSLLFVLCGSLLAQSKVDILYMLNGTEHRGKVHRVTPDEVAFVHEGEELEYTFKKAEIFKIAFASGRMEVVNAAQTNNAGIGMAPVEPRTITPNTVAILPFRFVSDASPAPNPEMARMIQDECFRTFNTKPGPYTYQDPMKTVALLRQHGIDLDQVRDHSADELCALLGVDLVVMGVVARNTKGTSTGTTSGGYTHATPGKDKSNTNIWNLGTSSSTTTMQYETSITLTIFDHTGARKFDKEHSSFWQTSDAYKVTIGYLWKRSPLCAKD